jgi:hypothetical protein
MRLIPVLFLAVLALPAGVRAQGGSAGSPSDAEILRQFRQRCDRVLADAVAKVEPRDLTKGGIVTVAACFARRARLDWANARLARIDTPMPTGDMFWMYPMLSAMEAGRTAMSPANRDRIRELWRTYFPYRGDTENHWLLYYATLCLAAEANPGAGRDAWYNGKSSAENIAEARSYIEDWMGITTAFGQGEFNSPNYLEEYAAPLAYLAGYERDPKFRREARMMLDYLFYDYAVEQLNGAYGGAHSRIYPWQVVQPGQTPAAAFGWLLFGLGARQARDTTLILAMSGYEPPPILFRIAHARDRPYVDLQLKRTRWRMRSAGPDAFAIEGKSTVPVYKYTYMDRDFVLGSCQGGPLQSMQQETWSLIWAATDRLLTTQNTFFGLQPFSSPLVGTMYYVKRWDTAVHEMSSGPAGKLDYDSPDKLEGGSPCEQVFQHGPALIALYDIPPATRFPLIDTFFSRDLARRDADPSGWIFCQGGPAYFGYRPLAAGEWRPMGWTNHMNEVGQDWFAAGYAGYAKGDRCLVSEALKNGYVVQVAPARSYRSFADFKAAVRALPLRFTLDPVPDVTFTALDGTTLHARTGDTPRVDGTPVDYAAWPLFDCPYGHAARGSHKLEMCYGGERYVLDFTTATVEDGPALSAP